MQNPNKPPRLTGGKPCPNPVKKKRQYAPAIQPFPELTLPEVIRRIAVGKVKLAELDRQISRQLRQVQEQFRMRRSDGGPVDVPFPPYGKLGWSGGRRWHGNPKGIWRLVVIDGDDCENLMDMPESQCRADALHVLPKLAERLGVLSPRK